MKLAEALGRRAALEQKINELKTRLQDNVSVQEGDEPFEDPKELISELNAALRELHKMVLNINITNSQTVNEGRSITDMLAERDMLKKKTRILSDTLSSIVNRDSRYSRSEIKYVATVDPAEFRRFFDEASSQLRRLDLKIQAIGWNTELIEC